MSGIREPERRGVRLFQHDAQKACPSRQRLSEPCMNDPAKVRSVEALVEALSQGAAVKYVFFWGHREKRADQVDPSCFSQWKEAAFEIEGVRYPTAEHWMMAEKARLFGDEDARQAIFRATRPGEASRSCRTGLRRGRVGRASLRSRRGRQSREVRPEPRITRLPDRDAVSRSRRSESRRSNLGNRPRC